MRHFFCSSICIFLCLLATNSRAATLRTVYVDPDVVGGSGDGTSWANAYSSLQAADDGEDGDITLATGSDEYVVFECRSSADGKDTTKVTIEGWTTAPDNYILIRAHPDHRHNGIYGSASGAYKLETTDADYPLYIREDYVRVVGLQIQNSYQSGGYTSYRTIATNTQQAGNNYILIDSCILNCIAGAADPFIGITTFDPDLICKVVNTIIQNYTDYGMVMTTGASWEVYNCTIAHSSGRGIRGGGSVTVKNCAVFDTNDDFYNVATIDHCASDDGNGTNPVDPSGGDWNNEFQNPGSDDYRLKNTGNLYQAGESKSNDPEVPTDDIISTPRVDGSESIGAFEYLSVGAPPEVM